MPIKFGASYSSLSSGGIASPPPQFDDDTCYSLATSRPKNRAGRMILKETRHPVFRGVRKRNNDKWVCEMREPNKKKARIWLGTYPTAEMAARAHDVAALAFRGKSACLNFADSPWKLPIPASLEVKVIQKAANEAAQMFQALPPEHLPEGLDSASSSTNEVYVDEDEELDMPSLLADMAQGLLLSPPLPNYSERDHEDIEASQFSLFFLLGIDGGGQNCI